MAPVLCVKNKQLVPARGLSTPFTRGHGVLSVGAPRQAFIASLYPSVNDFPIKISRRVCFSSRHTKFKMAANYIFLFQHHRESGVQWCRSAERRAAHSRKITTSAEIRDEFARCACVCVVSLSISCTRQNA